LKKSGQLIIGFIVAGLALWYTLRNVSMGKLLDSFKEVDYAYLPPTFLLMALTYVARAVRWKALVQPIQPVKTWDLYSPLMIGFMAGVLPARAGELVRAYLLGKKVKLSFASSFATIVVERLFDLVMLLALFGGILVFSGDIFGDVTWQKVPIRTLAFNFGLISIGLVAGLMVFIFLLAFQYETAMKAVHWVIRPLPENLQLKIIELTGTFSQGLSVVKSVRSLTGITLTSALVWGLIVLQYYPLYWAYDLHDKSAESLVLLTVMVCILITVLPTPAFLGSFNAGVLIALHQIMGESEVAAVSLSFVAWTLNFAVIFIGGIYFMLHDHVSVKKLVEIEEED
jgi:uncharacterized protein (TIRG00374 family)